MHITNVLPMCPDHSVTYVPDCTGTQDNHARAFFLAPRGQLFNHARAFFLTPQGRSFLAQGAARKGKPWEPSIIIFQAPQGRSFLVPPGSTHHIYSGGCAQRQAEKGAAAGATAPDSVVRESPEVPQRRRSRSYGTQDNHARTYSIAIPHPARYDRPKEAK